MIWSWLVARIITPFLPWIIGGLMAAGAVSTIAAYIKGRADSSANCREAQIRVELETLKRDMMAWKLAEQIEESLQAELDAERKRLQQKVDEYETELAERPDGRCVLDQRDVDRLRGIGQH